VPVKRARVGTAEARKAQENVTQAEFDWQSADYKQVWTSCLHLLRHTQQSRYVQPPITYQPRPEPSSLTHLLARPSDVIRNITSRALCFHTVHLGLATCPHTSLYRLNVSFQTTITIWCSLRVVFEICEWTLADILITV